MAMQDQTLMQYHPTKEDLIGVHLSVVQQHQIDKEGVDLLVDRAVAIFPPFKVVHFKEEIVEEVDVGLYDW